MSTATIWETVSTSSERTELLAAKLGARLRGGEIIELISDLGGGKTTFARGLVRGTGSTDRVASPTFTVSREYHAHKFTIVHFDFYRLAEAGLVGDELAEFLYDPAYVTIVEWGEAVHNLLPAERLQIKLTSLNEDTRRLQLYCPPGMAYLIGDLT